MPCVYKDIKECFCKKGTNSHTETTILERHVEFGNWNVYDLCWYHQICWCRIYLNLMTIKRFYKWSFIHTADNYRIMKSYYLNFWFAIIKTINHFNDMKSILLFVGEILILQPDLLPTKPTSVYSSHLISFHYIKYTTR